MNDIWINKTHGLELDPIATDNEHRHNENGILFLVEMYLLKYKLNLLTDQDEKTFIKIVDKLQVKGFPGLYDRGEGESDTFSNYYQPPNKRRIISHDNLTAISCGSLLFDTHHRKDIAKHMLKYLFRFDNKHPNKQKYNEGTQFHPRDIFMYLHNAGGLYRLLSYIFFPLFLLSLLESLTSKYTKRPDILRSIVLFFKNGFKFPNRRKFVNSSGPLLYFVRLSYGSEQSILLRISNWILNKGLTSQFSKNWITDVFDIYFNNKANPNIIYSKQLKK